MEEILATLRSPRLLDCSPTQRCTAPCSTRAPPWHRSRAASGCYGTRLVQSTAARRRKPPRTRPELVADAPLVSGAGRAPSSPCRGVCYDLCVVIDIVSRSVVAWCVAPSKDGELAKELIADAVAPHQVPPGQLAIHADRASSMTSNPVSESLGFLGIARSHSPPHVSNDNPYSQAQCTTLAYCRSAPSASAASRTPGPCARRSSCTTTTSIATRASASTRRPPSTTGPPRIRSQRAATLTDAYVANPTRFCARRPEPPKLPTGAWSNDPSEEVTLEATEERVSPCLAGSGAPWCSCRDLCRRWECSCAGVRGSAQH